MTGPPAGDTVTHVRYLPLPRDAGTLALLRLEGAGGRKSGNVLDQAGLGRLDRALDDVLRSSVAGICITGTGVLFSAGADPRMLAAGMTRRALLEASALGQRVFGRLRDAAVPTFALLNGPALGGGAELALHCRYRVLATSARLGLPECSVGLVPGWGATQVLPRLADPDTAVRMAVILPVSGSGTMAARDAQQAGLADVVLARGRFEQDALAWVAGTLAGQHGVRPAPAGEPPARTGGEGAWEAAISRGRAAVACSRHATAAAPWRVLELMAGARHTPLPEGLAAERRALADLASSDQFRSQVYLQETTQRAQGQLRTAGFLSSGRGLITVCGPGTEAARLADCLAGQLRRPVRLAGLSPAGQELADADLVVFAIPQDEGPGGGAGAAGLSELDRLMPPSCPLVCTAGWHPVSQLASGLRHPERLIRARLFLAGKQPVLIEAGGTRRTAGHAWAAVFRLAADLGVPGVKVGDGPGFLLYRLLARFGSELQLIADRETTAGRLRQALAALGLPASTEELLPGLDQEAAGRLADYLGARHPGRFRRFPALSAPAAGAPRKDAPPAPAPANFEPCPVLVGAFRGLADEIGRVLRERIVTDVRMIDLGLAHGASWPRHLGGIVPYLDRTGASATATGAAFIPRDPHA